MTGGIRFGIMAAMALVCVGAPAAEASKHVLLLGVKRDHPPGRHEYMAGLAVLAECLKGVPGIRSEVVAADGAWPEGPALLAKADGIVLYLGEGARWMQAQPGRAEAIEALAKRGGGIVALHSGIMTKDPQYIARFRDLVGGCHGGPDRRYIVIDGDVRVSSPGHPIVRGVTATTLHDEFYFQLKFSTLGKVEPISQVSIEGKPETIGWAFTRPDGGRSFGFSGMDPHANWRDIHYRRIAAQAILWTIGLDIPEAGLPVPVSEASLLPPPK